MKGGGNSKGQDLISLRLTHRQVLGEEKREQLTILLCRRKASAGMGVPLSYLFKGRTWRYNIRVMSF